MLEELEEEPGRELEWKELASVIKESAEEVGVGRRREW